MPIHDRPLDAARHPTEAPRKHAIKTTFVKNVKKMTVLASQRIQASSKKSIMKLMRKSSTLAREEPGRDVGAREASELRGADPTGT
jgi:hypothetical protein